MKIDAASLQTAMFFIQLMMAAYFIIIWRAHPNDKAPLFFAAANVAGSLSASLLLYQAELNLFFSAVVPIMCVTSMVSLHFFGALTLLGQPLPWRTPAVIVAVLTMLVGYFAIVEPILWVRFSFVCASTVALCAFFIVHLRKSSRVREFTGIKILIGVFTVHGVFFGLALAAALATRPTGHYDNLSNGIAAAPILECVLAVVAMNLAASMLFEERATERLTKAANTDALTNLPNRQHLATAFEQRRALAEPGSLAVALVDLDGFKEVNDTLGHSWGDRLLVEVSARLKAAAGDNAIVGRLGGDEFAILLGDVEDDATLLACGDRLVSALRNPIWLNENSVRISGSVGLCPVGMQEEPLSEYLRRADIAMYDAKRRGRDLAALYSTRLDEATQRATWLRQELRHAIYTGVLPMVYQPKFDVTFDTPKLVGMEALMRWTHPERGAISPSEFIPIAEQTGLINVLGARSLEQACRDAQSLGGVPVAVNLSPAQFETGDIVDMVATTLARTGLPAHLLELEITESVFLKNDPDVGATLKGLRALGVRLALDDFGTGYSSLSYLTRHPFDTLKIDRSFVRDCVNRPDAQAIMRAVTQLARAIALDVVAEGVETQQELDCVRSLGCRGVQGFLLGAPQTADEFARLWREARAAETRAPRLRAV